MTSWLNEFFSFFFFGGDFDLITLHFELLNRKKKQINLFRVLVYAVEGES